MKKNYNVQRRLIIITFIFFHSALKLFAQGELAEETSKRLQNRWLIGATSNIGYLTDGDVNVYAVGVKTGFFVVNNLAVGVGLDYLGIDDNSVLSANVFTRYYVVGKVILGTGYEIVRSSGGGKADSALLELGLAGFINKNIAIEPVLNYRIGVGDNKSNNLFNFNLGFSLYF